MRTLVTVHNDIAGLLRQVSRPIDYTDPLTKSVAEDLMDYMLKHRADKVFSVSMSACQLGELVRIITFYPNLNFREREGIEVLINPEITKLSNFKPVKESCLSIPDKIFIVERASRVKVRGTTLDGLTRSYKAEGVFAQMLQHEVNHLDGVLIDSIGKDVTPKPKVEPAPKAPIDIASRLKALKERSMR